ncbi:hypothetical protein MtrunA17_Chr3g0099531 [Medicago truncatula]|uniref:Transmembrane protein n=1 Tax=Medicago truncatula TaxID=3880 RepID=A0A396INJ4_MEDTR|nr:hypothetical protein MtrunA17_Chr3g0099531 [Medicago truncatula]
MNLVSSTLQIWRYGYSKDLNIVIYAGLSILSFYAINMNDMRLFADSSSLFLANLYCIVSMYSINSNEWISFIFSKRKRSR